MHPNSRRRGSALVVCALALLPMTARAGGPLLKAGELPRLEVSRDGKTLQLPLRHTDVRIAVAGYVASAEVTQTYENPYEEPIEAVYVFPLPSNSAVDGFKMVIGKRVIEAEMQRREEARRTYEEARRRGNTAALLEQERPNIFTQSIANIAPKEEIKVVVHYVQDVTYDDGTYEVSFPMVVGPRYNPGAPAEREPSGTGPHPDTTQVEDASRISTVYTPSDVRTGHDVSLAVSVEAGVPIQGFEVPTHEVTSEQPAPGRLEIRLSDLDSIPNRDFVLRYKVAAPEAQAALLTHWGAKGGYFTLVVQPPALAVEELVGRREIILVVDTSGSMDGLPIWLCKEAMREALARLRPVDTFNVISFAGATAQAFASPRLATEENVQDALGFVSRMQAGGGTEMLNAIDAALRPQVEDGRKRFVFFLTDGFVGNEQAIVGKARAYVEELERKGQTGRVFSFGVGSSPNRMLIDGLAEAGKGLGFYATNREDPTKAVVRFFRLIDRAVLEDVSVDWGRMQVDSVHPNPVPDLFLTRPLVIHGRYRGKGSANVVVRGYSGGRKVEIPVAVSLSSQPHGNPALATLWARSEIHDVLAERAFKLGSGKTVNESRVKEEVVGLGITYKVMTPYTSFVAVDRSRVVGNGKPKQIQQPSEMPEDVNGDLAGAATIAGVGGHGRGGSASVGYGMALGSSAGVLGVMSGGGGVSSAEGFGGLGLSGTGAGGGGYGGTVGLGGLGSRGTGAGRIGGAGEEGKMGKREAKAAPVVAASSIDSGEVQGSVDVSAIKAVFKRNMRALKSCYEQALRRNPAVAGKVVVKLTIGGDGKVTEATMASSTMGDAQFDACLLARIKTWRFPATGDGKPVTVTMPLAFSPGS